MKRLLLALGVAALTLLLAEGVLSLGFHRSLRGVLHALVTRTSTDAGGFPPTVIVPGSEPDETGLYRMDPDPLVGYVLRPGADLAIFDGHIRSDDLGLRARPGPPRAKGALRIDVLGDSVAFGFGLNDDQTLAHRLELLLNDAEATGARPVECRTVAEPGWNHRNAVHFLLDHMDELRPDIVLYLPIANDLLDSDSMDETSHRLWAPDPAAADPWLAVSQAPGFHGEDRLLDKLRSAGTPELAGASVLIADISPESSRRYDENADSIALLAAALEARHSHLMLVQYQEGIYSFHLRRRLDERGLAIPALPLFGRVPSGFTLGFDPHPNADTVAGMASWVAAGLMAQHWVPGNPARLPTVSAELSAQRAGPISAEEIRSGSERVRSMQRSLLRAAIDFDTGEGASQIYGGVHDDGSIGAHALFALRRAGPTLHVRLATIHGRPDLLPLAVDVLVDGQPAGRLVLASDADPETVFNLPTPAAVAAGVAAGAATAADAPIEVRLVPEHAVVAGAPGHHQLVACRVLRLSCE